MYIGVNYLTKTVEYKKIFSENEILYLQLQQHKIDRPTINKILKYKINVVENRLASWLNINNDKTIGFPIVMVVLSPFFNPLLFQGAESYPLLQVLVNKLENTKLVTPLGPVPNSIRKYIVRDIVNCLCYKEPLVKYKNTEISALEYFGFCEKDKNTKKIKPKKKLIKALDIEQIDNKINYKLFDLYNMVI